MKIHRIPATIASPFAQPVSEPCLCGEPKSPNDLVCTTCWYATAGNIRHQYTFSSGQRRQDAAAALRETAAKRRAANFGLTAHDNLTPIRRHD